MKASFIPMAVAIAIVVCAESNAEQSASGVCRQRLADIASGRLSADDQPVIETCLLNRKINNADVENAYRSARQARDE